MGFSLVLAWALSLSGPLPGPEADAPGPELGRRADAATSPACARPGVWPDDDRRCPRRHRSKELLAEGDDDTEDDAGHSWFAPSAVSLAGESTGRPPLVADPGRRPRYSSRTTILRC